MNPSLGGRVFAQTISGIAGCYFFFFALVALQGLLLIALPPRIFNVVTGYLQGLLVPAMLALIVLSFSIQPAITSKVLHPNFALWLLPCGFLDFIRRCWAIRTRKCACSPIGQGQLC